MNSNVVEKIPGSTTRIFFIDNIRILLVCFVILMHCSITFGGLGDWYVVAPGNDPGLSLYLTVIVSVLQSFFMGLFFMISAYFIPGSLNRKGLCVFIRDRLIRLGIPLVIWTFLINPLLICQVERITKGYSGTTLNFLIKTFFPFTHFPFGPMWFVFTLLVFSIIAACWLEAERKTKRAESHPFPVFRSIVALGLLLGIGSFLIRIFLPIGWNWELFNLQFPFFLQYIVYFILGIYTAKNNWFVSIPDNLGKKSSIIALLLIAINPLVLLCIIHGGSPILGGLNWQTALYAFWEQLTAIMIVVGILWLFRNRFNHQSRISRAAAEDSYTVYIIHPIVLIFFSIIFFTIDLPTCVKFIFVLVSTILVCFIVSHLIRSLPGVKRVL